MDLHGDLFRDEQTGIAMIHLHSIIVADLINM